MKKLIFFFVLALGFSWNCHAQSWTFVQEAHNTYCVLGNSSCSFSSGTLVPTTAGTVRVVWLRTGANVTITSVSGAGSTWNLCPASSCHVWTGTDSLDMAYAIGGSGGSTNITVNYSGGTSAFQTLMLYEFLPPSGATATFDNAGTANSACSGSCTAVALTVSGTDLILQTRSRLTLPAWNAWSSPYTETFIENAFSLNDSTGAAPTLAATSGGQTPAGFSAIAFKSSSGIFTPPAARMKTVNYTFSGTANCSPSCSIIIPSTTIGNLLFLSASNTGSSVISSVTGGGTWIVPSGANTCQATMGGVGALSCAYVLSVAGGVTSVAVTMSSSNANMGLAVMEVAPIGGGAFSFDTQGSTHNAASFNPPAQSLKLSGTADVIFQAAIIPGGTTSSSYYPLPPSGSQGRMVIVNQTMFEALTDAASSPNSAAWGNQQNNATLVTGVAFKTGTAQGPNPPSGLTAVIN